MRTGTLGMDFTQGNIAKLLLRFLTPFLLASVLNSLYNTVDMIIIGRFVGNVGTVAVSQGGKMLNIMTLVCGGFCTGGQVLVAQHVGAGHKNQTKSISGTLFSLLGIAAVTIGAACFMLAVPLLRLMNTPGESFAEALAYLRITCVGLPFVFGYNAVSSVLRGMGDSKNPLLFVAIAAVVNLILDIVFIVVLDMGAAGTALATVIALGVSLLFSIVRLGKMHSELGFSFDRESFRIDGAIAKDIIKIGMPLAGKGAMINITQLFIISHVNAFGLVAAAAYGIGDKIIHLSNIVSQSTNQAGASMVAQNIGAGAYGRAKQVVRSSLLITLSMATLLSIVSCLFPAALFSMFTKDPAVMAYSVSFMWIAALTYYLAAVSGSYGTIVTGAGNAVLAFWAGFLDGVVFRIAFSFLLGYALNMGATGFFLGNTLARLALVIVYPIYYYSGAWTRRKIIEDRPLKKHA